jgi:hypothetical protein
MLETTPVCEASRRHIGGVNDQSDAIEGPRVEQVVHQKGDRLGRQPFAALGGGVDLVGELEFVQVDSPVGYQPGAPQAGWLAVSVNPAQ